MKIAIIGPGNVGTGLAKHLHAHGHSLFFCYSRDPAKLAALARPFEAASGSVAEAVAFADVVVLAVPFAQIESALSQAGSVPTPKILWDCTNALKPDLSGLVLGTDTSGGEKVQQLAPWARVVKAVPPFADVLQSDDLTVRGEKIGVFTCSDDAAAKAVVAGLLDALGFAVTDAGGLSSARYTEPAGFLIIKLGYEMKLGPRIGLKLLQ